MRAVRCRVTRALVVAVGLVLLSVAGWALTYDDRELGTAVLGGYRDGWFLLNAVISYAAGCALAVALLKNARGSRILRATLVAALPFVAAELLGVIGVVDYRSLAPGAGEARGRDATDARLRRAGIPGQRVTGEGLPDLHPLLGAPAEPIPFEFETDLYGLRNPRTKHDPEVLCLGDSLLVAGLVPIRQTVTERLERQLGVEVLNVSEPGFSPQEALIRLETTGLDPSGKLVLQFVFEGNDLADSKAWRAWRAAGRRPGYPESSLLRVLLRRLHQPRLAAGRVRRGRFPNAAGHAREIYFLYDGHRINADMDELPHLEAALLEARASIEARHGRYALVLVPFKLAALGKSMRWPEDSALARPEAWSSELRPALRELAERQGFPVFDATPALEQAVRNGRLPYFAADTHLNAEGHAALAEALTPWIRDLLERGV